MFSMLSIAMFFSKNFVSQVHAAPCEDDNRYDCISGCTSQGMCAPSYKTCILRYGNTVGPFGEDCGNVQGSKVVGGVRPPVGVGLYNASTGEDGVGILIFFSRMLQLFTAIAGLAVFANFLYSAYIFISKAGDSKAFSEVQERLTFSVIGIVIIVAIYIIAAIIGLIFFGDAGFILQPNIVQFGALSG